MAKFYFLVPVAFLVSLSGFGLGGRSYFSGPGIAASQTVHVEKPGYQGRDTTAIYAAIQATQAPIYNLGEGNKLVSAQVYKSYSKKRLNLAAGFRGYHGAYSFAHPDTKPATYGGAGLVTELELAVRGKYIELLISSQLSCMYEFGKYQQFQRDMRSYSEEGVTLIWKSPVVPSHSLGLGLNFKPTPDFRFGFGAGFNFPSVPAAYYGKVFASYRSLGVHYIGTQALKPFMAHPEMYGTGHSLGLSYCVPFGRKSASAPDNVPELE